MNGKWHPLQEGALGGVGEEQAKPSAGSSRKHAFKEPGPCGGLQLNVVGCGQSPFKIHVTLGKVLMEWRDHGHS